MARKQKKEQPKPAELTPDKIKNGIIKLKRRRRELAKSLSADDFHAKPKR